MFSSVSQKRNLAFIASLALMLAILPVERTFAQEDANGQATSAESGKQDSTGGKQTGNKHPVGASGLPVPRFVSLKPARVNLRIGPGRDYAVSWLFMKAGLPVEIIQEYDNWRRIRDADGTEGWVYQSLLSSKRTAITAPWRKDEKDFLVVMRREANDDSRLVAEIEPGVIGNVQKCNGQWCRLEVQGRRGWIKQSELWGVYPDEIID
ncbi:SH3 domain-containing protein [Daeguia caeni]|uniref:SH3 domain-containing protein n=1 Tax=Daeguia caeni TaxID=439612 RepID=A0ABV9H7X8_9HYPH